MKTEIPQQLIEAVRKIICDPDRTLVDPSMTADIKKECERYGVDPNDLYDLLASGNFNLEPEQ